MKTKAIFIALCIFILGHSPAISQNSTDNEEIKTKVVHSVEKLDAAFKFEKAKRASIEDIFNDFYTGQQKLKSNLQRPASGLAQGLAGQDFQSTRKKNEALHAERDSRLKKELSETEYKKWKAEIEPSLQSNKKGK